MSEEELLARYSTEAVRTAARVLGVKPLALARRLQYGEVARLMQLLNAALPHVSAPGLRHRMENLLSDVTDGQMPMFERPESELDWAMQMVRQRRRSVEPEVEPESDAPSNAPGA